MELSPFAGKLPAESDLVNLDALLKAYDAVQPDWSVPSQRVLFGTSGHRGSSFDTTFNRNHILAMSQAICLYRKMKNISGPLFLGFDTHALSMPAFETSLEVLAANGVEVMISANREFTPTPVISHAILCHNRGRSESFADGIVITPSHNPPREGGFKYNPPHGGPAEKEITDWIQNKANEFLKENLKDVRQIPFEKARKLESTHEYDFLNPYIRDLGNIIDMELLQDSKIKMGVDPLGGAGVHYWQPIADYYKIDLTVLNTKVDPCFSFMTRDHDGQIRMDPSSQYAMQSLIQKSQLNDISFACDTDHDRHGIVTKSSGLMPSNHYLATMIYYLFTHRPQWTANLKVGKTLVSSSMIDRVSHLVDRKIYEVPVGFKFFVAGLLQTDPHVQLGFGGEESAGASFLRKNAQVWTTDKDAFVPSLLAAEMTAKLKKDPAQIYKELTGRLGETFYGRVDAPADAALRDKLKNMTPDKIVTKEIGQDEITRISVNAAGNGAPIGGLKIETSRGWLAIRPSGTEDISKIYAESFANRSHLESLLASGENILKQLKETPHS